MDGIGFSYTSSVNGALLDQGVLTGTTEYYNGQMVYHAEGFNIAMTDMSRWIANNDWASLKSALFHGDDSLAGGMGDDTLDGFLGSNTIYGGAGDDLINGSIDAFNRINGNTGEDTIWGWSHVGDWLSGGQGNDRIDASLSDGHSVINGNLGSDILFGGSGGDTLRGGQGDDVITGGAGKDWITGDLGNDTMTGGHGADTFRVFNGGGQDRITDFNAAEGDRIQLDPGTTYTVSQIGADTVVDLGAGNKAVLAGVTLTSLPAGWIFGA